MPFRSLAAVLFWTFSQFSIAAPATSLRVTSCPAYRFINCPLAPMNYVGQPTSVWVYAVDASGARATDYTGTISITSADPLAVLPPPHTLTLADQSGFLFSVTLNTLQSSGLSLPVFATDAENHLSGSGSFLLSAALPPSSPVVVAVPTLSTYGLGLLAAAVALSAACTLRFREKRRDS